MPYVGISGHGAGDDVAIIFGWLEMTLRGTVVDRVDLHGSSIVISHPNLELYVDHVALVEIVVHPTAAGSDFVGDVATDAVRPSRNLE